MITGEKIWNDVVAIRERRPLIHNITNYVVMNITANALLAIGASPVMAHAEEEVADMVAISHALVINIGTLSTHWVRSMLKAAEMAMEKDVPIIVDPVGAGATPFRTEVARELVRTVSPAIIRGNPSEIISLAMDTGGTRGVDSAVSAHDALPAAEMLHQETRAVVCISGPVDYVMGNQGRTAIHNGHPLMAMVTGMGCTATALCGAFAAVNADYEQAAVSAMAVMGVAGEVSAQRAMGPGSMQCHFLDALYQINADHVLHGVKIEHA